VENEERDPNALCEKEQGLLRERVRLKRGRKGSKGVEIYGKGTRATDGHQRLREERKPALLSINYAQRKGRNFTEAQSSLRGFEKRGRVGRNLHLAKYVVKKHSGFAGESESSSKTAKNWRHLITAGSY